jgi:hypothetical protein
MNVIEKINEMQMWLRLGYKARATAIWRELIAWSQQS